MDSIFTAVMAVLLCWPLLPTKSNTNKKNNQETLQLQDAAFQNLATMPAAVGTKSFQIHTEIVTLYSTVSLSLCMQHTFYSLSV
jgi:hypothetical protein